MPKPATPLWEKHFDAGSYHINGLNSYASSTPAVDADHIYLLWLKDGRVKLTALTHDGNEVWHRDIGPFEEKHGFGKSPIVVDDLVYVANDSEAESAVVALDRKTGEVRWHVPRESGTTAFATPCLFDPSAKDKLLLTVSTASGLTAIERQDRRSRLARTQRRPHAALRHLADRRRRNGVRLERPRRQWQIAHRGSPRGETN